MKQRITIVLVGGLLALILIGVAIAGPLEDGEAAYRQGDYASAMRLLRPLAGQGNAAAQNSLGVMYAKGQGVPQDYAQALIWYREAADQGNADAQNSLGFVYAAGQGVAQDYAQAVMWWRKAADQGNAKAQSNLGEMYANGWGVPQDYAQAYMWFNLWGLRVGDMVPEGERSAILQVAANWRPR
jgi:TPR repeat protein